MNNTRKSWVSPADRARRDAFKHLSEDNKEKRRRWCRLQYKWEEHDTLNPNGVKVTHIPFQEPIPEKPSEIIHHGAKANNWKYNHKLNNSGKFGEQKHYNPKSTRALTDEEAVSARLEYPKMSMRLIAIRFGVSEKCVMRCVKGFTYKHLNHIAKPHF